ncbi:MAG: CDP-alcohol phosphatidyltransferase family protein [Bacilli bacterium]|nr:CDP-alcohol phosphatidyltransferase family protein [Bacilli bacterium]
MKKYIPNLLTTYRLITAFLIPVFFFLGNYNTLAIMFIIAIISDALDGYLARRWNVTSNYGKIVDIIGDKALAIMASITFIISINNLFILTLILEIMIILVNSIDYIKSNKGLEEHLSSKFGKIKTWFLFTTLFVGFLSYKINFLKYLLFPLIIITAIAQIITFIDYFKKKYIIK